ncbi:MAG: hypothetical protein H6828_02405 [Planctomycetes bacterium]|nr:hypothetical protein [Planctomycetota bacterium]
MTATAAPDARELVRRLREAVAQGDDAGVAHHLRVLFEFDPALMLERLDEPRRAERHARHEALDDVLRGYVLADDRDGELWRTLMLPAPLGALALPLWLSNARWMRAAGSTRVDAQLEPGDPARLADLPLELRAKALGRYLVVNDGARPIDARAWLAAVGPELQPALVCWLLSVYAQSPDRLTGAGLAPHQRRALEDVADWLRGAGRPLATSVLELETANDVAYATDANVRELVARVVGGNLTELFVGAGAANVAEPLDLEVLPRCGRVVIAPNWRPSHVVHRCLAPLLEGQRTRGAAALLVHEPGKRPASPPASDWNTVELELAGAQHYLIELGAIGDALAARDLELVYYPEVAPSHAGAWLAMRRLARVQAAGYGFPVTTGLETIDYYVGGREVEGPDAQRHYVEQLVLLPGLGVSTTTPPAPRTSFAERADGPPRLASAAGLRKLNAPLLRAWDEVLAGAPGANLDLYPAFSADAVNSYGPRLAPHLRRGGATLHGKLERQDLVDRLAQSDLYLDSFPFGGFNTLVEVLASGCPFVTLEGDHARNRFGAALLRRVGLPEFLIARDWRAYVAAARRVLGDAGLRAELRARLADRDAVLAALRDPDAAAHFDAAVERMLARGPRRGSAERPLLI